MKRHPAYTVWMLLLTLACLCGIALLVFGASRQPPQPGPVLVPPQVRHG